MAFWTYMLHCRGGYFYVGHTDDLDRRISEHLSGLIPGFTSDHQPVELVWSDEFQTREDAKAAERKLKGWSRAKKLALIRDDSDRISTLAKKKDSASTSSAGAGVGGEPSIQFSDYPELVEGLHFSLQPHPESPPSHVRSVDARLWMTDSNDVLIEFLVSGSDRLLVPEVVSPVRRDGLWQTTCFEFFLMEASGRYFEFNLSPSTEWAAYRFDSYRDGMVALNLDVEPLIERQCIGDSLALEADVDLGCIPACRMAMGLSAVIEETDGTKSYWALAHPPGKPDFHHPSCFTATLPPPSTP